MAIDYRFLPWARRGLVRAVQTADALGIEARPQIQLGLTIAADRDGSAVAPVTGQVGLRLFGPADIVGLDTRLILRTDPKPNATSFEPNYLALVDFDPPDFPWMFTPAQPGASQRLRPWLVLVVFDRAHVALPRMRGSTVPLPSVRVPLAVADAELPDLDESWLWAHAQATSAATTKAQIEGELLQQPERNVSRLISPRRLEPSHNYFACLVPAFDVGRRRGLGQPLMAQADAAPVLQAAWARPIVGDVELPVYFHWEFSTGPAGDFESLARRIKTPKAYVGDATLTQRLQTLGTVPMSVDGDRLLTTDAQPISPLYEGALTSVNYASEPHARDDVAGKLQTIVNAPQTLLISAAAPERAPTVAPPIYGAWHARKHIVDATPGRWLNDLNRDPRFRAAAGKGTEVVRANQEAFMDACWGQIGEVLRIERALARAAVAKEVQRVLHTKLKGLPDDRFLAVAGPAASRIRMAAEETVHSRIRATSVPNAVVDPGLRRLTSAQRPALKAAVRQAAGKSVATQVAGMVATLVKGSQNPHAIDPNRYVPDGILGSKSYDRLAVPDDPATLVDLSPIGLGGSLRADQLRALQTAGQSARQWYDKSNGEGAVWRPKLKPATAQGLLTEAHFIRFAQLSAAANVRIPMAEIARQVQATAEVRRSEGVLISLSGPQGLAQSTVVPLRIDGRTGAIQAFASRAVVRQGKAGVGSRATKAAALRSGFGTVAHQQVGQFGNTAIFSTLPVNSLPLSQQAVPVAIGSNAASELAGLFQGQAAVALPAGAATVTIAAPLHDRATLTRFAAALKDVNRLWFSPLAEAGVKVKALDFPLAAVAAEMRRRTDPELTVPARLAATLSVGGSPLAFDAATRALSNPFIASALASDAAFTDVRYVLPRLFDRVMAFPKLEEPMAVRLARMDTEAMLPGANAIPNDFLVLARTNNRFIESFMVGINHEMARELLWRGFPTDQRGTPMRHFWDRLDGQPDIRELHTWNPAVALGHQPPPPPATGGDKLVLVIRATLIKRFPNLTIYAQRKHPAKATLGVPANFGVAEPGISLPATLDMIVKRPIFAGPLPPDLVYVGFDIPIVDRVQAKAEVAKWCFVLEEQMTEPRFGFDEPDSGRLPSGGGGWKDVTWNQVLPADVARRFLRLNHLVVAPPATPQVPARPVSLANSAHAADVAKALLQRPFRAYYIGTDLLP
ncbi:MAG: hypothetical protein Q8K96_13775 [Rubrivivax sp.]|nr:hypothetical protein [Rubrivivax sp.]